MSILRLPCHISSNDLREHFSLTRAERELLKTTIRKDKNVLGFAVLLKTFLFLGRFQKRKKDIPKDAVHYLADLVVPQYSEMVKHFVAVVEKTGPVESILRRFNSYNRSNPVYKAFTEAGKAFKTIYICRVMTSRKLREEIEDALNVVENYNSSIDFLRFGRRLELQTNDPEMMELTILCSQLLQNAVILANTVMVERILEKNGYLGRMTKEDYAALTPLFLLNVNPYGDIRLNFEKPSFLLEAAL